VSADYGPRWPALRRAALRRDGYRCVWCGADVSGWKAARVDHIVPVRVDPSRMLDLTNLRTLCPTCDNRRHAEKGGGRPPEERVAVRVDGFPVDGEWS